MMINIRVTFFAGLRTHIVCRRRYLCLFRLLLMGQRAKASNKENEFPTIAILDLVRIAPGGHSRQLHAIFDNVMNFAIRKILGRRGAKVRRARIQRLPYRRQSTSIMAVASLAFGNERISAIPQILRSRF